MVNIDNTFSQSQVMGSNTSVTQKLKDWRTHDERKVECKEQNFLLLKNHFNPYKSKKTAFAKSKIYRPILYNCQMEIAKEIFGREKKKLLSFHVNPSSHSELQIKNIIFIFFRKDGKIKKRLGRFNDLKFKRKIDKATQLFSSILFAI